MKNSYVIVMKELKFITGPCTEEKVCRQTGACYQLLFNVGRRGDEKMISVCDTLVTSCLKNISILILIREE